MSAADGSGPVDRDVGRLCSHCRFPLPNHDGGLRHYGTHTAHQENECLRLLHAELDRLRAGNEELRRALGWMRDAALHGPDPSSAELQEVERLLTPNAGDNRHP
jgi:hypothetical protein